MKQFNIKSFNDFNYYNLIRERLHINDEMDSFSDSIYPKIKQFNKSKFIFNELPPSLNISKLIISIKDNIGVGISGELDLNKSKQTQKGWEIYITLKKGFSLYTLKHELNHSLRLTLLGKDKMIKNLNYIKSQSLFTLQKDKEINYFLYLLYLSNEEEINSKISETHGYIKELMNNLGISKLNNSQFDYIIKSSDSWTQSEQLINSKFDDLFKKWKENDINKLLYLLEENKKELDTIQDSRMSKLKLIIKTFKDILSNKTSFNISDNRIYKPTKNKDFYEKYINKQGSKLRKKIIRLYDHYQL